MEMRQVLVVSSCCLEKIFHFRINLENLQFQIKSIKQFMWIIMQFVLKQSTKKTPRFYKFLQAKESTYADDLPWQCVGLSLHCQDLPISWVPCAMFAFTFAQGVRIWLWKCRERGRPSKVWDRGEVNGLGKGRGHTGRKFLFLVTALRIAVHPYVQSNFADN